MTHQEIEHWPQQLSEILKKQEPEKRQELLAFAEKVGASRSHWARIGGENDATESQLIDNIQRTIQTAAMIDACKTAAKNYKIACVAAVAAAFSSLVALVSVLSG